jgi:hypothetical protein
VIHVLAIYTTENNSSDNIKSSDELRAEKSYCGPFWRSWKIQSCIRKKDSLIVLEEKKEKEKELGKNKKENLQNRQD